MSLLRFAARACTSAIFIKGGIDSFSNPSGRAQLAGGLLSQLRQTAPVPASDEQLVQANAVVQAVAGSTLALGIAPRLSATALGASLVPTTLAGHAFWEKTDPQQKAAEQVQFAKNLAILGGLIYIATS
ncbi:DoxX family protein [Demetria terragena]|uniref:DoxX family protein n=1 Tax=Demetria terragena TaxID=63959 RepID=UPI0003751D54|nr:DoxX family protein [Demetria terragena]